jgi:hypothetical protein
MIRLIIPKDGETLLDINYEHTRSSYGLGVVIDDEGDIFSGENFRLMRDVWGARIETDRVEDVCRALGVPAGEPGIVNNS